jgi:predicted HicB family RNase H-like nuclease
MKKLNTRLPDDVHDALTELAVADRRSLNSMIIVLIEEERQRRTGRDSPAT